MRPTVVLISVAMFLVGCGGPDKANIALRKERQALRGKITGLERTAEQLRSQIRSLESDTTGVETLPQDRLEQLFTIAGIRLGKLTRRSDEFEGLVVWVEPFDDDGDAIKAVGGIRVGGVQSCCRR